MNELKPCPFCGASAYVRRTDYPNGEVGYGIGGFHDDNCIMERSYPNFDTKKEAIEAWNRRAGGDSF